LKGFLFNYIYFRIKVRSFLTAEEVEIYIDLKVVKFIIDRAFLINFKYIISIKYIIKIRGVNGKFTKLSEWATFNLYFEGEVDGKSGFIKVKTAI
ncbi:hypothetical protein B0T20DRAFT_363481, partial [Sordaria brevicollis]